MSTFPGICRPPAAEINASYLSCRIFRRTAAAGFGLLLWLCCTGTVLAGTTITTDITASGSGVITEETLSNDTTLTGNVRAEDEGVVRIEIFDTSGISGSLTADRDGIIYLTTHDNAWVTGDLVVGNGGDGEVSLNGNTIFSGMIDVNNSGGEMHLTMNDNASLTGLLAGGSHSVTDAFINDSASLSGGVEADDGGTVNLTMSGGTSLSGGIRGIGGGFLNITASDSVTITSPLSASGQSGVDLQLSNDVTFTGDMDISGSGSLNLTASDNTVITGDLTTSGGGTADVILNGSATMTGGVTTNPGGRTDITLNDQTSLTGDTFTGAGTTSNLNLNGSSVFTGSSAIEWGTANISLNGAGTAWYVTQSSRTSAAAGATGTAGASAVSNLTVADGAWVYLGAKNYAASGPAGRVQLDVNTLSGSGNFELRLHVAGIGADAYNDGDLIHVTNTSGSHNLYVPSTQLGLGAVSVNGQEILKLVHSIDGGGQFSLYEGKTVDIGHLTYKLVQQNNHWYLIAAGTDGDGGATDPGGPVDPLPPDVTNVDPGFGINVGPDGTPLNRPAETAANFMTANYLMSYMELQTLQQRMGDLRHCRQGDLWVRGFAGRLGSKRFGPLPSYSMNYYGFQIGADKSLSAFGNTAFAGVMAGYTRGDPRHHTADSDIESYHAGVYGVYGTEDDFYIDAAAKVSHLKNKFTAPASDGYTVRAKGSGNAFILNLEMGKRFYFTALRDGFYLEPQVQGTYTHQKKISLYADNGLISRMSGYNSVLVRAGGEFGYSLKQGRTPVTLYGKAGYVRELTAEVGVHYNKIRHRDYDYKGGWFDAGAGVTAEFREKHAVYFDLEYSTGKRFHKRQANLGYRFAF